jgi:GMP synthase (glutamine-hydrolysing)
MKLHIITHESFEAPGAILHWTAKNNCEVSYTKVYQNERFPENLDDFDFLIIMGGPQSPSTTIEECPHFDTAAEINFIKKAISNNKFLLGICLGSQLIGEALGAKFDHSPNKEIGLFELSLTEDGKKDPIIGTFPEKFMVGHWHGDMPGLTESSKILAYSEGCPRQIVKYSEKIYGFQCHFEFTPESIEGMIENSKGELEQYKDLKYVQNEDELRNNDYTEANDLLFKFLDYVKLEFDKTH